ncbi:MAG TPA: 3-deoxy-8-phosphooctulonate synthase [Sedimentisphaerales bacterium]|nr:3-deoxy-8-phosphooctulonate synthase [Sedimentisphaerales bacterium]
MTTGTSFQIGDVVVGLDAPLFVMAGPCVIESEKLCLEIADRLVQVSGRTGVPIIFKASFDKANRSSYSSFRGPGLTEGMRILAKVRAETGLPVMTDLHEPAQAAEAGATVDCLQIPAFLCRQTDLLVACAETGQPISVKKGQFVSPGEMGNVADKIRACQNNKVILTERGTFFGYNRLVNDMTGIPIMQGFGCPVVFDATHSTQQPGGLGSASGGQREMAPLLARAAVAAGVNGLFLEVHPEPEKGLSDAATMLPLDWLEGLVQDCRGIFEIVHG